MKLKTLLTCLFISTLGVTTVYAGTTMEKNNSMKAETAAQTKNDAEAMSWLMTVDKNEIELGKLAKAKSKDKDVTNFANMMIKEHTNNLHQVEKLSHQLKIKPVKTAAVDNLKKQGQQEKADLKSKNGTDFEKNYMQAMVDGHQKVLDMLDDTYLKNVNNDNVKKLLETTRTGVEHHLDEAKKIQSNLA